MRNKAYRRRKRELYKRKTSQIVKLWDLSDKNYEDKIIYRCMKNRKACSCSMCGNYRKNYGQTFKENKADLDFEEQYANFRWNQT